MHMLNCRRGLFIAIVVCMLGPGVVWAQDAETLKRELESMRQQFDAMKQQYERRMRELSDRLQRLEVQQKAGPPATSPAAQEPTPPGASQAPPSGAQSPSVMDLLRPRQPFALAQPGRILLFDIGVAGDFVADFTSLKTEQVHDGTFNGRENRLFPRHVELGLFGRVDPYASASVRFTGAEEPSGPAGREAEITAKLEEANGTLLTLPFGTTMRFGLMAPRFGTLNVVHEDDLPQVDRPNVLRRFFGQEEMNTEKGVEAFWLLPTPFYQELSLGVFNGDNEVAFGRGSIRDPLFLSRLRSFFELGESGGLQVDFSGATGETSEDRRNTIAGLGVKYKWFPPAGYPFPVITLAGEAIYGYRGLRFTDAMGESSTRWRESWGYYVYGQYDWTKRWAAGLRYDWAELPTTSGREWAFSPYLQFKPSEFLRFRAQYKHTNGSGGLVRDNDEVFLQGSFIMGAHPTERF